MIKRGRIKKKKQRRPLTPGNRMSRAKLRFPCLLSVHSPSLGSPRATSLAPALHECCRCPSAHPELRRRRAIERWFASRGTQIRISMTAGSDDRGQLRRFLMVWLGEALVLKRVTVPESVQQIGEHTYIQVSRQRAKDTAGAVWSIATRHPSVV